MPRIPIPPSSEGDSICQHLSRRNSLNPRDKSNRTVFFPDTTYRVPASKEWREGAWYQVYPKITAHHACGREDIDFTDHLRIQPHVPTPRPACPLCSHFHSSVIAVAVAALRLCHHHSSVTVVTCGLERLNFEYQATSNQVLPRCNISTSPDCSVGAGL